MSYQRIVICGNVGKDAEMRYTPSGAAVASFSVAATKHYKSKDGEAVKETAWFRVEAWGKTAEAVAQYVVKGMLVLVEGTLKADPKTGGPRVWEKDGKANASFEIRADQVRFLSSAEGVHKRESSGQDEENTDPDF